MDVVKYATVCAVAVAAVTAGGAGVATGEPATPCTSATPEILTSVALRDYGEKLPQPVTVFDVKCSGDWAFSSMRVRYTPGTNPPNIVLFHHDGSGGWRTVTYGSGFQCTGYGVPESIAAEITCS